MNEIKHYGVLGMNSYKKLFDSMLNESVDELFSSVSPIDIDS